MMLLLEFARAGSIVSRSCTPSFDQRIVPPPPTFWGVAWPVGTVLLIAAVAVGAAAAAVSVGAAPAAVSVGAAMAVVAVGTAAAVVSVGAATAAVAVGGTGTDVGVAVSPHAVMSGNKTAKRLSPASQRRAMREMFIIGNHPPTY